MTTALPANGLDSASTNLVTEGVIKQAIANASQVTNFISQQVGTATDKAPSEDAVNSYVTLKGVKVDGTALTIDTTDKTVNLGAAAGAGLASGITSSETGLTSGQQVYNYIDSLPAADIPAMPTATGETCDADHPCALVTDSNGAPVWKRIAQVEGD